MGIDDQLRELGYEFDEEHADCEPGTELWINREIGMGLRLEWFKL